MTVKWCLKRKGQDKSSVSRLRQAVDRCRDTQLDVDEENGDRLRTIMSSNGGDLRRGAA